MLDSYTKLLLQGNRTVGPSSAIIDEMGHAVTKNGDVQISTSTKKFGDGSIQFDGTGDYLTIPDSSDWFFDTGDFTIDFWINFTALPSNGNTVMLFCQTDGVINSWTVQITNDGGTYKWEWYIYESSYTFRYIVSDHATPSTLTTGQWYHIAVTKNSNDYRIFRDGTQCGITVNDSNDVPNLSAPLYISYPGYELNGYLDEIRISKGIARWTSNFTLLTEQYYDDSLYDITWIDLVNVTATGNDLEKTSGSNSTWDAGAFSTQGFIGDGKFEFTTISTNKDLIFGLSTNNPDENYNTIDYAIYLAAGNIYPMENGSQGGNLGTYNINDVFSVERIGTTIYYKKNGVTLTTSGIPSSGTLYADVSFYQLNGFLSNGQISSPPENEILSFNETVNFSETWDLQLNPDSQVVSDILSLSDSWEIESNPAQEGIFDTLQLSDGWELQVNPDNQSISDNLLLSDSFELLTNPEQATIDETITLSDSWLIDRTGTFTTAFLTKLYMILPVAKKYATDLRTIYGTSVKYATKLYLQYTNTLSYKTDLRVTTPTPISIGTLEDFVVKLDGITLTDVDYNTLLITLSLNTNPSTATFTLARRHDDLDYKLDGTLSIITAENKIEVFDGTRKLFTGYISEINADSQNDTVHVTASDCRLKMSRVSYRIEFGGAWRVDADHNGIADDDITENTNNIPWNAPDYIKFEKNIGQAFTEVISQASSIISGYDNLPFSGTYVPEFITSENNLTYLIDELIRQTANCNWYIDENERLKFQTVGFGDIKTLNLASLNVRRHPYDLIINDVRLNIKSPSYAKKITVKLGKNINQVWRRQTFSGNLNEEYQNFLTNLKDKTAFIFHQTGEHVYPRLSADGSGTGGYPDGAFYTGMNGTTIFYFSWGVYLSYPTSVVQWLDIHSPLNTHLNLPDISVGSGTPTKTLYLTSYGVKTGNVKWGEEVKVGQNPNSGIGSNNPEGDYTYLVYFQDEQYDRRVFATDLANFELSQNNNLETSASLSMLLDAYEYYNLSFSNLLNLSNTLRTGIYNNNNGFPLNVDNIKIDCSKRTVNLGLTNYGKSYYVKTANFMTNYTPPSTIYVARKVIWQIIDADGHLHSTG